ncbi:uncharacterized protein PSFLO_00755 [Pseudozyma flocculosa]|uniref:Uncharacterized protein n=1 Tax=Pseudozyma flocculosa TaxID=84751 RepID=A0A5C3ESI8_9BASI|nr:uncharacterized protein PSFLO_00755 [Pseudozyma flocculosa]
MPDSGTVPDKGRRKGGVSLFGHAVPSDQIKGRSTDPCRSPRNVPARECEQRRVFGTLVDAEPEPEGASTAGTRSPKTADWAHPTAAGEKCPAELTRQRGGRQERRSETVCKQSKASRRCRAALAHMSRLPSTCRTRTRSKLPPGHVLRRHRRQSLAHSGDASSRLARIVWLVGFGFSDAFRSMSDELGGLARPDAPVASGQVLRGVVVWPL